MNVIELAVKYVFPFLLVFSIIYGILDSIELFKRKIRAVISFVLSAFAILYIQITLLPLLETLLPAVISTLIILFGAILILGMIGIIKPPGAKESWLKEHKKLFGFLFLIIFIFLLYLSSPGAPGAGAAANYLYPLVAFLIIFGVFFGIIYLIVREGGPAKPKGKEYPIKVVLKGKE